MIKTIKLNTCSPYQEAEIVDCKRINFIFGANGSGKSTISSFLDNKSDARFSNSTIEWTGESHEIIEVYNKAFRQNNLQQDIKGIFTLGNATIEEIREVERLKSELEQKKIKLESHQASYRKKMDIEKPEIESQFKNDAWNQILKRNETDFQKAFEGFRGSKDKFIYELKKRIENISSHTGKVCNKQDLQKRAESLFSSKPERCDKFILNLEKQKLGLSEIRFHTIWDTVITGSEDVDISALIKELNNSSWVSQGRKFVMPDSKKCPFCQKETIDDEFRLKLQLFFDNEYKRKVDLMTSLLENYTNLSKQIIDSIEDSILDKDYSLLISKLNIENFTIKKELLRAIFEENERNIEEKISFPEKRISITDVSDSINEIENLITEANTLIDLHNKLVDQRVIEEVNLRDDVWSTCIDEADPLIKKYKKDISDIEKAISGIKKTRDNLKAEVDILAKKIEEKEKNITGVQPSIDAINQSLRAYGFTNFSIQPAEDKDNFYCIKRDDGTYATNTLSEGEETFLSFLYFMQKVKGSTDQAHVSDKKIIVLDDPISSLDSTILYIVGAMVKDLSIQIQNGEGDVTQLFVLTHNVFFHKEASFINGRTQELKDVNFWMIRKNAGISTITAYGMKNPISTSYELLWKELKEDTGASLISVQNIMRRIIENYFGMLGGKRDDILVKKFENTEDKIIAKSLLFWINDGSHSIPDDLFIDSYTDAIPRYKDVFRGIFEKSGNIAHYNMMMGISDENEGVTTAEKTVIARYI